MRQIKSAQLAFGRTLIQFTYLLTKLSIKFGLSYPSNYAAKSSSIYFRCSSLNSLAIY